MTRLPPGGLLYDPEVTTQEEIDTYRKFYVATKGYSPPAFEFWLQLRPDVLKRYRANFVRETTSAEEKPRPLAHVIAMPHQYRTRSAGLTTAAWTGSASPRRRPGICSRACEWRGDPRQAYG